MMYVNKLHNQLIMNDKVRKIVIAVLIIAGTAMVSKLLLSQKEELPPNELKESVPLVSAQRVMLKTDTIKVPVYGYLESQSQIDLFPEAAGKILNENFQEGEVFQKGEIIVKIDQSEFETTLKSARSQFYSLMTNVLADLSFDYPEEYKDWHEFLKSVSFTEALPELPSVDNQKLKTFLSGKGVFNSYYSITAQENRLKKYQVVAPFTGVLKQVNAKPGTVVRNGQNIGVFSSVNIFELKASLNVQSAQYLKIGDQVLFSSDEIQGEWVGKVARVNRVVDQQSQNIAVYISISSEDLFSGMYLTGEVATKPVHETMVIKRSLIVGNHVFVIEDDRLVKTKVQILSVDGEKALVQGLKEGQMILRKPLNNAKNGMKVRVQ